MKDFNDEETHKKYYNKSLSNTVNYDIFWFFWLRPGKINKEGFLSLFIQTQFLVARAALYLTMGRTVWVSESFTIHHSQRLTWQCVHIWSGNLQLPYKIKMEVIWEEKTSNLLVYNFQLPHKYDGQDGHHGRDGHPRTGRDRIGHDFPLGCTSDLKQAFFNCLLKVLFGDPTCQVLVMCQVPGAGT